MEYETQEHRENLEKARAERLYPQPSCLKCVHMKCCVIARNIGPMMDQMYGMLEEKDKPFKGDEIAKICNWYQMKHWQDD
jgi:hypothetical protein